MKNLWTCRSNQDVRISADQSLSNGYDLLSAFPLPEDNFWETMAQAAMVVNFGKSQILVGQFFQECKELVFTDLPCFEVLERLFQTLRAHLGC